MSVALADGFHACTQCRGPADRHISWLAKVSETESRPDECYVCEGCLSTLWSRYAHTQWGETLTIEPA